MKNSYHVSREESRLRSCGKEGNGQDFCSADSRTTRGTFVASAAGRHYQPSISNSSVHNTEPPTTRVHVFSPKVPIPSLPTTLQGHRDQMADTPSPLFFTTNLDTALSPEADIHPRNRSQSSACTVLGADPCSTTPYAPERESSPFCFHTFGDGGASSPPATSAFFLGRYAEFDHGSRPKCPHFYQQISFPGNLTQVPSPSSPLRPPPAAVTSFHSPPTDHMGAASRFRNATITPKGQEGMLSFWSVRRGVQSYWTL
jgi:hypothetical protein